MLKKYAGVFLLFLFVMSLAGCETCKGAANGFAATATGVADGAKKDWENARKIDAWMRKNLW